MSAHPVLLLVDDDVALAEMLRRYLGREGYELLHVTNAGKAIAKWRDCHAELLILDLMLPDGSGLDLCREVRRF
jgi:DNA-binding response OmpR family regulator